VTGISVPAGKTNVHFTPTSASWLNLVERWFALLTERQLRRGVHRSTKELKTAIYDFIEHYFWCGACTV
jgi:hypothetical protein